MWITKLELSNIKSHEDSGAIPFAQGVNAISGPNGAGKSTLLEAIGFALFDSLPYTQAQFLREGEKSGEVVVSFIDSLDEREYQVVRKVGSSSIYIYDPEVQSRIVTGKADVVAWLKEHLGVDGSADLTALFEDSIGVPQGLLSAAFLERPASRKAKFDPLLQVDDYEEAWIRLREVTRVINDEMEALRQKVAGLTGELKHLPTLEQERSRLQAEIEANQSQLELLQDKVNSLDKEQADLEAQKEHLQELQRQAQKLESRLKILETQSQEARSAVEESEQAAEVVEATEQAHSNYLQAEEQLEKLEAGRSERDRLRTQKNELDKQLALAQQRLSAVDTALDELETVETQLEQLEPQVDQQRKLTESLSDFDRQIAKLEEQRSVFESEQARLASLETRIRELRIAVEQAEKLRTKHETTRQDLQTMELETARLEADRSNAERELQKVQQHLSTLDESKEADCPVCHQPLDADHRATLLTEYVDQADQLGSLIEKHTAELANRQKALAEKRAELENLTHELDDFPDAGQLTVLEQEEEKLAQALDQKAAEIQSLQVTRDERASIEDELNQLGDPETRWTLLKSQLEKRAALVEEQRRVTDGLQTQTEQMARLDRAMQAFDALDDEIATYQAQRQENQAGYRSYLANAAAAGRLTERQAHLQALIEELEALGGELEQQQSRYENAADEFDQERFTEVRSELIAASRDLARLETIVEASADRLNQVETDIAALQQSQQQLVESEAALERHAETAEALEFIRTTIRRAGPFVTRALVQTISLEANRIFGEIMNDHTLRLMWDDEYSITIERAGEQRDFSQLSGGEKTAAALSVRLALLRELSQIRVAFFDEPTSNLDDQRRENLAGQITQITGFNQLFVISHDDTFERETHHVIHVEKSHGASQVEVG